MTNSEVDPKAQIHSQVLFVRSGPSMRAAAVKGWQRAGVRTRLTISAGRTAAILLRKENKRTTEQVKNHNVTAS
jgi:hypothetical protein